MTTHSAIRLGACCMILAAGLLSAPSPAHAGSEKTIYLFKGGLDGDTPIDGLAKLSDRLYGVTQNGGAAGTGTVFYVKPDGTHRVIHSFTKGTSGSSGLIYLNGKFFSALGGSVGDVNGSIYSISPGGAFSIVYSFTGGSDGSGPIGPLVSIGGNLYGVTAAGGVGGHGTVFMVSPQGVETVLHNFGNDPQPIGTELNPLMTDGTTLFGTTIAGGNSGCGGSGCGTVYSVTPQGKFTEIYSSFGKNGATCPTSPFGTLVKTGDELYGIALCFYSNPYVSSVFKVSLAGVLHVVYTFNNNNEGEVSSNLTRFDNSFYGLSGTTIYTISRGVFSNVYTFPSGLDTAPQSLAVARGSLYGLIYRSTGATYGGIFSYTP